MNPLLMFSTQQTFRQTGLVSFSCTYSDRLVGYLRLIGYLLGLLPECCCQAQAGVGLMNTNISPPC